MSRFIEKVFITKEQEKRINDLLTISPNCESECFGEDEKFSVSVTFDNGYTMYVELCGVQYEDGESNLPWTQAVLYDGNGGEITFAEPCDEFMGEWELEDDENVYVVNVVSK